MIITGSITNAGPCSPPLGKFQNLYQDVVIRSNDGYEYTGKIASKKGYANNTPIQVTYEEKLDKSNNKYLMFYKYNPDYPQGGEQQNPPPQNQQHPPQQQAPQSYNGKDIIIVRQCCAKAAATILSSCGGSAEDAIRIARCFEDYVFGRSVSAAPPSQPSQPSGPNPDYDPNYVPPDDVIPF